MDSPLISRRSFLKGAALVAAMMPLGAALSACGAQPGSDPTTSGGSEPRSSATDQPADPSPAAGGTLVAFFSATGTTRGIGEAIAERLGADVFEIEPVAPYTAEDLGYNDSDSRTSRERSDPNRSVELVQVTPDGFDGYDTVFIGYPIWWGDASWVVDGFVAGNDFSGKRVVPFCTSGSSPIGQSGANLAAAAGTGEWLEGTRFGAGASADEVAAWVDGLGL